MCSATVRKDLPEVTVARLPLYLRLLADHVARGSDKVSSEELAQAAGVRPSQLRKDLSYLGSHGVRGVGYDPRRLTTAITSILGLADDQAVAIVGMGRLGQALARYPGLTERGFRIAGLFDLDPTLWETSVGGVTIRPMTELPAIAAREGITLGVVATPSHSAQAACDDLLAAGIGSILNFAPGDVCVPDSAWVRHVDVAGELQILAFHARGLQAGHGEASRKVMS